MRQVIVAALGLVSATPLLVALFILHRGPPPDAPAERFAYSAPIDGQLPKLWQAPEFSYVDQHNQTVTLAMMRGRSWIADFIFTQCTSACPVMTSKMISLQRSLSGVDVRFVSFSVDPAHDLPSVLAQYAQTWSAPSEARWTLLATQPDALKKTVSGFRVTAEATNDPSDPLIHSTVFLLIDADGWIRGVYDSDDETMRDRLTADARRLSDPKNAEAAHNEPIDAHYASLGCAGCHSNPRVAPSLDNLIGSEVTLQDGSKINADDAYVRRSILQPSADVVAGYSALMPSYATQLTIDQVATLAGEVEGMKTSGAVPAQQAPAALVTDPVCHMSVRAAPETVHVSYKGRDVYFCSDTCRDTFTRDPAKFPLANSASATP
jgi:protein SCO1/2